MPPEPQRRSLTALRNGAEGLLLLLGMLAAVLLGAGLVLLLRGGT
jgi:hypothetical protein